MPRIVLASLALLLSSPGAAAAQNADIEAAWSFSGGQVAVQSQSGGGFVGTIIRTTTLAQCPHPVGEQMWTGIARQGDGSYWGAHQYFRDRKSTRLNSSHANISYAVFCLKKKILAPIPLADL